MPRAIICIFDTHEIDIDEALQMRDGSRSALDFRCVECGEKVRPHHAGVDVEIRAHFEHLIRNPVCSRSDA